MIYSLFTFLAFVFACFQFNMWGTVTGGGVFGSLAVVALYLAGKVYCLEWRRILQKSNRTSSLPLLIYESGFLPAILILIIAGTEYEHIIENSKLIGISIGLFCLSADLLGMIRRFLISVYPGPSDLEAGKLFLRYPPVDRMDLLPMDALLNFVLLVLLWKRLH